MISCPCGRRSIGNTRANRSGSVSQPLTICGRQRRGGPGVDHVGIAGEAARHAALLRRVAGRHVGGRVDRQPIFGGHQRAVVVGPAVGVERVPDRDRHAEEPLPADQPVAGQPAHPVLVAVPHVRRHPAQLAAAVEQRGPQVGVPAAVADVPLPGRDDLQRRVAALVELHRVGDRARLADQVERLGEQPDDLPPRLVDGAPGERRVRRRVDAVRRLGQQPPVAADHHPGVEPQLAPPGHVGEVAERADHRDAGALVRLRQRVRVHRHLDTEDGRTHGARRTGARSARRRGGRPAPRTPAAARAGWSRCRPARRPGRGSAAGDRRPAVRGLRAPPARPRCRSPTSHSVGASAVYASPRARLRRNARCEVVRACRPIVV